MSTTGPDFRMRESGWRSGCLVRIGLSGRSGNCRISRLGNQLEFILGFVFINISFSLGPTVYIASSRGVYFSEI